MAGWTVTASGNAEDPEVHKSLLRELRHLLRDPAYETGSSEFASAHAPATNLHIAPPGAEETAPPEGTGETTGGGFTPGPGGGGEGG